MKTMNMYREDDSGELVGDMLLEKVDEEELLAMLLEGNTYITTNILRTLAYGSEKIRKTERPGWSAYQK